MCPDTSLSPAQHHVLALMSAGTAAQAAARSVGVHRNTVGNWLRSPVFRQALIQARTGQAQAWRAQAAGLASEALGRIGAILTDPHASAALRLRAALAIQSRAPKAMSIAAPRCSPAPARTPAAINPASVEAARNTSAAAWHPDDRQAKMVSTFHLSPRPKNIDRCTIVHNRAQSYAENRENYEREITEGTQTGGSIAAQKIPVAGSRVASRRVAGSPPRPLEHRRLMSMLASAARPAYRGA
jgi:hypothetical protein